MKKHIKMGDIPVFSEFVRNIKHQTFYLGKDENGDAIYDYSIPLPIIKAKGFEKIHGTQMGVSFNNIDGFWVQSKNNIITTEKDNAGCAFNAYAKKDIWLNIIIKLANEYNLDLNKNTITVFAEWCGGNIQKNSAASGLDKRAVIFRYFKVTPFDLDDEHPAYRLETIASGKNVSSPENNIFNIADYPHIDFIIDINNYEKSQNEIMAKIIENEEHSPFGKAFGKDNNILEGYVFSTVFKGTVLLWKIKGDKHSKSKVKNKKTYTPEELAKFDDARRCAEEIFSHQRCNQALREVFGPNDEDINIKRIGDYLKWLRKDIIKECTNVISDYGLEPKDVMKYIQEKNKQYFFGVLDKSS